MLDSVVLSPSRAGSWICLYSPAHLPDLSVQPVAMLSFAAAFPTFISVLTEAPFSEGWCRLGGQKLGAAIDLGNNKK